MVRKHTIKKETNFNAETGDISITEEHVIIEKHDFLHEEEEDEDLMFIGKKQEIESDDEEPTLIIFNDDDKFW